MSLYNDDRVAVTLGDFKKTNEVRGGRLGIFSESCGNSSGIVQIAYKMAKV